MPPSTAPRTPDVHGDFLLEATRGSHRQTLVVRGNLSEWLRKHDAVPTADPTRFKVGRFAISVERLLPETMEALHGIFGDPKYAPRARSVANNA